MGEWKLVPVDPTEAMARAYTEDDFNCDERFGLWSAVIAAAPRASEDIVLVETVARGLCAGFYRRSYGQSVAPTDYLDAHWRNYEVEARDALLALSSPKQASD